MHLKRDIRQKNRRRNRGTSYDTIPFTPCAPAPAVSPLPPLPPDGIKTFMIEHPLFVQRGGCAAVSLATRPRNEACRQQVLAAEYTRAPRFGAVRRGARR